MPPGPSLRDRLVSIGIRVLGFPLVLTAQRVVDRFGAANGGVLAAGIAYNAVFALIPLALLASGIAGLVLSDPESRAHIIDVVASAVPPLSGIVDDILTGLAQSSPTATIIGLVLAGWGTSRLFASLESAIVQLDLSAPRRGIVRQTARRIGSVIVVAGILLIALLAAPLLTLGMEMVSDRAVPKAMLELLLELAPPALGAVALAVVYRLLPLVRPTWRALSVPSVVGALAIVVLTRAFVFLAPRLFAGNVVYGTLGAILVGLAWLNLVFTVILIGAAWVIERRAQVEPPVA